MCVLYLGRVWASKAVKHSMWYLTSLLKSVWIQISSWQGLPIRMGSSKVQCGLDWLFNNKHPCEWKIQKQWRNLLILKIRYKALSFIRYHLSINYNVASSFYLFPLILYDGWLSLHLCKSELQECNKGLANQKSTICHVLGLACFIEALNETHNWRASFV